MNGFIGKIVSSSIKCLTNLKTVGMALSAVFFLLLFGAAALPVNGADAPAANTVEAVSVSDVLPLSGANDGDDSKMSEQTAGTDVNAVMYSGAVHALHPALKNNFQRWNPLRKVQNTAAAVLVVAAGFGTVKRITPAQENDDPHHFIFLSLLKEAVPVRAGPSAA